MISETEDVLKTNIDENKEEVDKKILRIEEEELSVPSLFGPHDPERKFKTMKDFMMDNLEVARAKHTELLTGL